MNQTLTAEPILNRMSEGYKSDVLASVQNQIDDLTIRYGRHSAIDALVAVRDRMLAGQMPQDPATYWAMLPYAEYLQSEYWQDLRNQALDRAGYRCQLCNERKGLQVHHRSYERRGLPGELQDLTVLCGDCHEAVHCA